jgi:ABC-type branched-subunit amino acid transport system permease subunit
MDLPARDLPQRWPAGLALFALCTEIGIGGYVAATLPSDRFVFLIYMLVPLAGVVVGGVLCTIAFLGNPRSRVTQLVFGLHVAVLLFSVLSWKYQLTSIRP